MTDTSKYAVESFNEFSNLTVEKLTVNQGVLKVNTALDATSLTAAVDIAGGLKVDKSVYIKGNATITGNLIVHGNSAYIYSDTIRVEDKNIELGFITSSNPTDATADGGGMTLKGTTDKYINWYKSDHLKHPNSWGFSENIDIIDNKFLRTDKILARDEKGLSLFNSSLTGLFINKEGNTGLKTISPNVSLHIDATDALKIPTGTTNERPTASGAAHKGYIRYNTDLNQFEGYGTGNAWGSLGGVIDIDQDTKIVAEENSDEDKLRFYTKGVQRMIIDDNGNVGIGNASPSYNLEVSGISLLHTLSDSVTTIYKGTITSVSYINSSEASISKSLHVSTLTDSILTINAGTITNVNDIKTNIASVTKNLHVGTLTDGILIIENGTITNVNDLKTEIASVTKNLNVKTLTDSVLTIINGTITGVSEIYTNVINISKTLSLSTLTDGILKIESGTITNVSDIKTNIASVTKNLHVSTLTDGILKIESGTITNVSDIKTEIASITKKLSIGTLTDSVLKIENGTITNVNDIYTNIASVTKNLHVSTLTDNILTIESGTITNVNDIKTNIASVTKNFHVSTLTDSVLTIESGTITNGKYIGMENGTISNNFIVNNKLGVGTGATTPNGNIHIKTTNTANTPMHIEQLHHSSPFLKITGISIANDASRTLVVDNASVSSATIKGYVRVEIVDNNNSNGLTDGAYYIPLYTLT